VSPGQLAPGVELAWRAFSGRLGYEPGRDRLELRVGWALGAALRVEVAHASDRSSVGPDSVVSLSLLF
ncbi:MAG TPA: hypothetical protein VNM66_06125, partial [Thermodesulfobacteriota bacterium]|nr:hypothetical protein [Thermodesulfobacteriota bacterium]